MRTCHTCVTDRADQSKCLTVDGGLLSALHFLSDQHLARGRLGRSRSGPADKPFYGNKRIKQFLGDEDTRLLLFGCETFIERIFYKEDRKYQLKLKVSFMQ